MLERVCANIHNYFISAEYPAQYSIASGVISPAPPLKEGLRFWLVGSDLNDGVYTYHADVIMNDDDTAVAEWQDEDFAGTVCAMAVPREMLNAVQEGLAWQSDNESVLNSPYTSENVTGIYSYTMAQEIAEAKSSPLGLPSRIASVFDRWRKTCL